MTTYQNPDGTYSIYFDQQHPHGPNFTTFQQQPQQKWTIDGGAAPQPQATTNYHSNGQGMNALMEFKSKCEGMWLGWIAYRAGSAYYEMHADPVAAGIHGATALRRWWIWLFFFKVWLGSLAFLGWMTYLRFHEVRGESFVINGDFNAVTRNLMVFIVPALLALLITYTRNIDFSLFKRNGLYRLVRKVAAWVEWVPNWALYLIVFCPLFFPG